MNEAKTTDRYQNIVEQAKKLFIKHGIHRVTVQEISKEAGVSKMTFYRLFKNKEDVAGKVLQEIIENSMQSYRAIMKQNLPFASRIQQMMEWKQTLSDDFSDEFIKDIFNLKDDSLRKQLEEHRQTARAEWISDLKIAQEKGWLRKDVQMEFILFMLNDMDEKMKDERFLAMYDSVKEAGMELTKFFFSGLMSNENTAAV